MPTWTACAAKVHVDPKTGKVKVEKLTLVVDAGTIVSPDGARAQVEGSALWGMSLALFEGTFGLHSQRLFAFGSQEMSVVFIVCGSVMGLLQLGPVAWLIKKKGENALLPYGLIILSIGMSLLMLSNKMEFVLLFVSIVSVGMAILSPCLASLVTKDSKKNYGTTLGIFSSVNSLGQVLGVVSGSIMMIWFVHLPYFIISIILLEMFGNSNNVN